MVVNFSTLIAQLEYIKKPNGNTVGCLETVKVLKSLKYTLFTLLLCVMCKYTEVLFGPQIQIISATGLKHGV